MGKKLNLKGQKFGKLTVLSLHDERDTRPKIPQYQWNCICECGNHVVVTTRLLKEGHKKSCGCLLRKKLNMSNTRIYRIWFGMKDRCNRNNNTRYKYYGGYGIGYCKEWEDFNVFYEDMKDGYSDGLSLERIDYTKDYCKDNCKWVTQKEQVRNRSITKMVSYNGEVKPLAEWAEIYNLPYSILYDRYVSRKWTFERAITQPIRIRKK